MRSIKRELGIEKDDKESLLGKFREKLQGIRDTLNNPDVLSTIESEIAKIESLEKNSSEFNVARSYLDWLLALPWGKFSDESFNLNTSREVLDRDHYGLDEIKKGILEFIAVGKLKGSVVGKIMCFIGPPGVGKTSIATSIAEALGRKFYRFSVGGLSDVSEVKGHRRTYVGAMPGKPIQALKSTDSSNPLILIDEIDKLGRGGYQGDPARTLTLTLTLSLTRNLTLTLTLPIGDPASALLELLDPSQNHTFVDHFIDLPIDFSRVLFVCTANDESSIPGPLRDRMEIIRLAGYDIPEKVSIADKYLVPRAIEEAGLGEGEVNVKAGVPRVEFTMDALERIVKDYCRESGVRQLQKHIEKVSRKIAFKHVEEQEKLARARAVAREEEEEGEGEAATDSPPVAAAIIVGPDDLEEYLGKPRYSNETIYDQELVTLNLTLTLTQTDRHSSSGVGQSPQILKRLQR